MLYLLLSFLLHLHIGILNLGFGTFIGVFGGLVGILIGLGTFIERTVENNINDMRYNFILFIINIKDIIYITIIKLIILLINI